MSAKILKPLAPEAGVQTDPLSVLKVARDVLVNDKNWATGAMFCPLDPERVAKGDHEDQGFENEEARDAFVDRILKDGLCGAGWGVCAVGAVSLAAGLTAVVEYDDERYDRATDSWIPKKSRTTRSLVNEFGGSPPEFSSLVDEDARETYQKAVEFLNDASRDLIDPETKPDYWEDDDIVVWAINDADFVNVIGHRNDAHGGIIRIFDAAIEKAAA